MRCKQSVAILIGLILASQAAYAYHYPLRSESIRDAYFLGERNNFQTTECLLQYVNHFSERQNGRYFIAEVQIATPYQQIILRGQRNTPGDSEVQTETDLRYQPLNFIVRVRIELNFANHDIPKQPNAWPELSPDLAIHVTQRHALTSISETHEGIYNHHALVGWLFELQFDAAKISSAPLHISVKTPDGQIQEVEFDMAKIQ
ncbi:MAG TPA: hypothetical protein VGU63_16360 [Candidatus Acidoferrales bacterium]|nr:hypothetical protein [Candidatus Acidoferrales bacterium]